MTSAEYNRRYRERHPDKYIEQLKKKSIKDKQERLEKRLLTVIPDSLFCYNEDMTFHKAYRTKADALRELGYNPNSPTQMNRAISDNKLWMNKYWKL